jgi:hypothetical protein
VAKPSVSPTAEVCKNGQKGKFMAEKQLHKMIAALVEHQSAFGGLTTQERQLVIKETPEVIALFVGEIKKYRLRKIFKPIFPEKDFIIEDLYVPRSIRDATDIFRGCIDNIKRNFEPKAAAEKISPALYELRSNIPNSFDWDKFFSEDQVVRFCEKYPEVFIRDQTVLFPFKSGDKHIWAAVKMAKDGLYITTNLFEIGVWSSFYHIWFVAPEPLVF